MPEQPNPEQDPITSKSYAAYYLIATVILMATLFWALWDEAWGQRPWKAFQEQWKDRYSAFLNTSRSKSATSEKDVEQNPDYAALKQAYDKTYQDSKAQAEEARKAVDEVTARLLAVQSVFTDRRAYVNALSYEIETSTSPSSRASKQNELAEYKKEKATVDFPDGSKKQFDFPQLEETYNEIRDERTKKSLDLGDVLKPVTAAKAKLDEYISDHMVDLTPQQIDGLKRKTAEWDPKIVQINVADANIVDRCESCHLNAREPLKITPASMTAKGEKKPDDYADAFVSHPEPELLKIHDPEKFGCSPCHQGNGRATTSIEKAHGNYEHWLWPLFPKENAEAGCQNCHAADMVLASGDVQWQTINNGKDLYRQRGCMGCHRYEGYDKEPEDLNSIGQQIKQIETQRKDNLKQTAYLMKQADAAESNEEANRLNGQAVDLKVANSKLDGRLQQLDYQSHSLMQDQKKVGPNLKDVRLKLNKNWIPVWLKKPSDFRPTTKMPNFRLTDHQIQAISAYIWQSGFTDVLPKHKPGNAAHGKELFETRGCLACHSIGEGDQVQGGAFAANLTRVGEKANYDYLVRWIHNARERTRPYCPYEKKDIGPEDYAKKGLPYQFDLDHSKCPNDGHELQVQNMTVMPSLRLSPEDAEDIATYLMTQKKQEPSSYADAAFMDDPNLKAEGKKWVRHFGCGGCHEISGMEDEGRIGTELTYEGSKPIERLDFALFTTVAERGGKDAEPITDKDDLARLPDGPAKEPWYDQKGFFEHKLAEPNVYDKGKIKGELDASRMPNLHLTKEQVLDLTTFLMGSEETSLPASYQYRPGDARHDIQEGWWVIKKYNCMGCHQFIPGQQTILMGLKQYQDIQEQLPPKLLTEGARVDPEWLRKFLSNPALSTTDTNRNGVRSYLRVRMPTFSFSDNELRKLVRFFQALSQQPLPYIPEEVPVLTTKETDMARSLFSSSAAPCLKCHATGDPTHDKIATAPNFLLAKERLKPDWVERWITDPQAVSPGTSMPSGLFKQQNNQWVFAGPTPPSFQGYEGDHRKLLTDYIFQLTAEEQRRVAASMPHAKAAVQPKSDRKQAVRAKMASSAMDIHCLSLRVVIPSEARDDKFFLSQLLLEERRKDIMNNKTSWRMISVGMLALCALLLTAACSKQSNTEQSNNNMSQTAATAPAATLIDPATVATVNGTVKFDGMAPKQAKIDMSQDPACKGMNEAEAVVVTGGDLANVFVYVKDGLGSRTFDVPKDEVVLDQSGCKYHPHVLGVMAGQTVQIKNDDQTTHNIHPTPKDNREWNESQPPSAAPLEKNFAREEIMLPVKCNQHPWMKMYINVVKSPFYAVTDKSGKYEIKGLPPGDYTIAFVHEKLGEQDQKVTVGPKDTKTVDQSFKAAGE